MQKKKLIKRLVAQHKTISINWNLLQPGSRWGRRTKI